MTPSPGYLPAALRIGGYRGRIVAVNHGRILQLDTEPILRRLLRRADRASGFWAADVEVAVSGAIAARLDRERFRARRVVTIPNGVAVDVFAPNGGPPARPFTIGWAGRFVPGKGVDVLLRAFDAAELDGARLVLAGDGPERSGSERLAHELGVAERVDFPGWIAADADFWRGCDLAVVAPDGWVEAFGLSALEAMACGVAVVATRNGGLAEVVEDGVTGRLVRPGDAGRARRGHQRVRERPGPALRPRRRSPPTRRGSVLHGRNGAALPRALRGGGMTTVVHVIGARPNYMKMLPVIDALAESPDLRQLVVHTGQHYDPALSDAVLADLGFPAPDRHLGVGSGSHAEQTGRTLVEVERVLLEEEPDLVVVSGDVNATLAGALAAAKLEIPVAHVEAGLRSRDWSMPEEINRVLTDRLADLLLTHSPEARTNLLAEGAAPERIHEVGNTMIDTLRRLEGRARDLAAWRNLELEPRGYVLVTLHRPSNVDDPKGLAGIVASLGALTREAPVVFSVHPRTRARLDETGLGAELEAAGIHVLDPLGYLEFLSLEISAGAVLTDSGGDPGGDVHARSAVLHAAGRTPSGRSP